MQRNYRASLVSLIIGSMGVLFVVLGVGPAYADTPSVSNVAVSPQSLGNNLLGALTWSGANASGYSIMVTCAAGVTVKLNGTSVSCGARQALGDASASSATLSATNLTGTTQSLTATIYPKDATGADYVWAAQSATFTVTTAAQPLTGFSVATTSIVSGGSVALSWTGIDTPGVDIRFSCQDNVKLFGVSPSTTDPLPCGSNSSAFSAMQGQSGSVTIQAINTGIVPQTITALALPAITADLYDLTHALSATFIVQPRQAAASPSLTSFTLSSQSVTPNQPLTIAWNTANASGANIRIQCDERVHAFFTDGTTTTPIICPGLIATSSLAASGTTTLSFSNTTPFAGSVSLTAMAQQPDGTFSLATGITRSVAIQPVGAPSAAASVSASAANTSSAATPASASTASTTSSPSAVTLHNTYRFTKNLARGSRGAAVTALQTLLAEDPALYPEGMVTGYYGVATASAVGRFQAQYGVAKKGDEGYGSVGPKTRAALNSL